MTNRIEKQPTNSNSKTVGVGDLTLLIAEDDYVSSEYLEKILKDTFQKIIFAENGKEAVQLCENNPDINLVMMDIKMPVMDGYDATRQIRTFNQELIIIAQTAYTMYGDKKKAIEAGCNDYIAKPFTKKQLLEIINLHLK